ncbi:xylulose kinase XylB [Thermoclostridium stercorarium subsp. stercorarium DSM 8532]|jgi:xylulokinase|uniref:Xylulose kinase n=2 Tax=Thermoclostridium stercorarium TaxID=1510 RepID=L7VMM9_THES1|nr:xylulokinase [Thermoclostridium stercorarium]AGC67909.1 xylulose kinase XylB [Thermoclostridium stercorarium subsp. stercorarium DSM 8532]AGI38949.1 Xyk [Thermoclostridium stercorarium subsp. stercorarium DSM 8532]ANX00846.1 xylulokinase [Thermoclostridium stercorarium subsp. leptospartum DSM 9219]UZQ86456.1 xylulokinase [Thermoclostridium stercorarium]
MAYLLGVDIGTSGTKTVLFDETGNTVASDLQEYPLYQPKNGWAEQDPEDWWRATYTSIRNVLAKSGVSPDEVKGVGLSGQMHGAVLLDKDNQVLRRAIIWCDQRSSAECEQITELIGAKRLIEITANPALTGFTASKVMWVKNNEPEIFDKVRKILLPKDYVRFCLTGEFATEVSDASGMQFLDVPNRCWSDEVISKLGLDKSMLGKVYESQEITGTIHSKAAELTGLKVGTPVVGGAGDQAAGAVGNGIVKKGIISSTIGTSGVVFAYSDDVNIDPLGRVHTFCHAVPNKWHIMGVTQGAGLSLQWFRNNFCREEIATAELMGVDPYYLMDQAAEKVEPGSNGIIYLPYLMGERTPHLDPDCRGVFFGLSAKHTKREMIRAVMEGVVYSLRDCLEIIEGLGVEISQVRASGGGGKSPLWRQMQADVFNRDICTINASEGPAFGVALLAGVGAGVYRSVEEACEATIKVKSTQKPNTAAHEKYNGYYKLYRKLYTSLKDDFKTLAKLV